MNRINFVKRCLEVKRGIFQGDSLSPLLFVIALIPLTMLLKKENIGYGYGKRKQNINHFLLTDDLKLYGSSVDELESSIYVNIFQKIYGWSLD